MVVLEGGGGGAQAPDTMGWPHDIVIAAASSLTACGGSVGDGAASGAGDGLLCHPTVPATLCSA